MAGEQSKKSITVCEVVFFVAGGVFILGGIALAVSQFAPKYARWAIEDHLVIAQNSDVVKSWKNPEFPVYMKFYVFNVTNGDAFIKGEKPVLKEHGPYTYRVMAPRYDIQFYTNDTVSFRNNNTFHFDRNQSAGSENDILYHINLPLVTIDKNLQNAQKNLFTSLLEKFDVYERVINLLGDEDLIVAHTVREIIFGYEEPMFQAANNVMSVFGKDVDPYFGPFHGLNNSDDGLFLVKTGRKKFSDYNKIERWNGEEYLPYWTTKYANMLNGTDGSFLLPNVTNNEERYLYFSQMHRSLKLTYEKDSDIKGVSTLQYHFADDLLESVQGQPDNIGFCVPEDNCLDSGLLNVGEFGDQTAPMFLSLPHFYNGSPQLRSNVVGLKPNKTIHDSVFHVEPMTGAVLDGRRRLQINTHVEPSTNFVQLQNVQPVYFPYFWLSAAAVVNDGIVGKMRNGITAISVCSYIAYVVIAIGVIMLIVTLTKRHMRRKASQEGDGQPLITEVDAEE